MHSPADFVDPTFIEFVKLLTALFLGGVIGTERAIFAHQPAGTRTFGLVAMGACLFVVISNYVTSYYIGVADVQPLYMAAGIITGIGFLGGGLIIFRGGGLHGVTTAAGLWITAAIGMSVGFGMFAVALFTTILALIMFTGMWYVENTFKHWFDGRLSGVDDSNPEHDKE
ncbi:MAG TPA: MgtC/SapB family protein [Candidatus Paceibacterota bacterium]